MAQSYLSDILHIVAQWLLVPDIILLLAFIAYALFSIGSVVAEYFTERRNFQIEMPKFLKALMDAKEDEIPDVVKKSGLLKRQKDALLTVYEYRKLPGDALIALVKRKVNEEETHYDKVVARNSTAARVAPMLGLMGTLIPLGPGIEALGRADTAALSSSLLVAFDTTVAGLVVAAVCLVVGKILDGWYNDYMSAIDASMATMLEKIERMKRAAARAKAQGRPAKGRAAERGERRKARSPRPADDTLDSRDRSVDKKTAGQDERNKDEGQTGQEAPAQNLGQEGGLSVVGVVEPNEGQ